MPGNEQLNIQHINAINSELQKAKKQLRIRKRVVEEIKGNEELHSLIIKTKQNQNVWKLKKFEEIKNDKTKQKNNNAAVGVEIEAKIAKNKLAAPGITANLELIFSHGIQKEREIIDLATEKNLFVKSGNWYYYHETPLGNGKENVLTYLRENPEIYQEVKDKLALQSKQL